MSNLVAYLNTFLQYLCGGEVSLLTPSALIALFPAFADLTASGKPLTSLVTFCLTNPSTLFSLVVWLLIGYAIIMLALVAPYKLVRYAVRKAGGVNRK